ncbi:MAG TPA: flagellar biosynthetic protein FliQ [Stellaceae bacterium]|nr:flagellar biosynthetic protein FliQ [Stellaceae bacterium]
MTPADIVGDAHRMLILTLLLVTPFLGAAVLASLVMGLIQASTRMTDLTLSFVPRFVAVLLVVYMAASWMSARMLASIEQAAAQMHEVVE